MLSCPEEDRIMISPDEDLPPVQLPYPPSRATPDTKITEVIDCIVFPYDAVPSFHEVAVHLVKGIKWPMAMTENPGMIEVQVRY